MMASMVQSDRSKRAPGLPGAAPAARRGGVPAWVPLALLFAGLFFGVGALERDARSLGVAEIDTLRYRLQEGTQWVSPAWRQELEEVLIDARGMLVDEDESIERFRSRVLALSFVAEVGEPELLWPDGLSLPLRMHEPTACVATGEKDYLPVAPGGEVLGGFAAAPHGAYGGWLPVIGPVERGKVLWPGDRLTSASDAAALAVADSMWRFMEVADLRRLGRIVIDATRERAPVFDRAPDSPTPETLPGGVVLELEDGRRVVFGRPPEPVLPGELPVGLKWRHVAAALRDAQAGDPWRLLDVRFDEAVRLTRAEVEEFAERGFISRALPSGEGERPPR